MIIMIITCFLDGIITNYIPYQINNLSIFTPQLTVISIFLIYLLFKKKKKEYFIIVFISGLIYDFLYTDLLFINSSIFLVIAYITMVIYSNLEINIFKLIIYLIILIIIYEVCLYIVLFMLNKIDLNIYNLIYKIINSILLNILYGIVGYLIINMFVEKRKKILN